MRSFIGNNKHSNAQPSDSEKTDSNSSPNSSIPSSSNPLTTKVQPSSSVTETRVSPSPTSPSSLSYSQSNATPAPPPTRPATPPPEPTPPAHIEEDPQTTATIGAKIQINGELVGEENIVIHGRVSGTIQVHNHTVSIGRQGLINANIIAKTIEIEGTVQGDLYGEQHIIVRSSSHVKGNLVAKRVSLEDGAKFRGSIDMEIESYQHVFNAEQAQVNS